MVNQSTAGAIALDANGDLVGVIAFTIGEERIGTIDVIGDPTASGMTFSKPARRRASRTRTRGRRDVGLLAVTAAIAAACDSPSVASSPSTVRPWIRNNTAPLGAPGPSGQLPRR